MSASGEAGSEVNISETGGSDHLVHVKEQRHMTWCGVCWVAIKAFVSLECQIFEERGILTTLDPKEPRRLDVIARKGIQDAICNHSGRLGESFVFKCKELPLPPLLLRVVILDRRIRECFSGSCKHLDTELIHYIKRSHQSPAEPGDDDDDVERVTLMYNGANNEYKLPHSIEPRFW